MDIPPVPNQPKTFKFPQSSFSQKNPVKRSFQSSLFAFIESGYITRYVCMLLTETESWTVRILIRRSYSMDFPTGTMLVWPLITRFFQVPSWFGEGSKELCSVFLCCQMLKRNNYQEYFFQHTYKINWIYKPTLHLRCNENASKAFLNLKFSRARSPELPYERGKPTLVLYPSRASALGERFRRPMAWLLFKSRGRPLSLGWLWKVD